VVGCKYPQGEFICKQANQAKKKKETKHSVIESINSYVSLLPILIHIFYSPTTTSNQFYLLYIFKKNSQHRQNKRWFPYNA